jgi:very-short-patch-repair endonuclease
VPIGPFIADFACLSGRLIVEVDGDQHGSDDQQAKDADRTAWLRRRGWTVLRFWTGELISEMDRVVDAIRETAGRLQPTGDLPAEFEEEEEFLA